MSSYAIRLPAAKTRRRKRKGGSRRFVVVMTGGSIRLDPGRGPIWGGLGTFLFVSKPHRTTITHADSGATLECELVSVKPWLAWRPWRFTFVPDDPTAGRRFVETVRAVDGG